MRYHGYNFGMTRTLHQKPKRDPKRFKKLRRCFRQHHSIVNALIAFIGFGTAIGAFLIKDYYRDRSKDAADNAGAAYLQLRVDHELLEIKHDVVQVANDQSIVLSRLEAEIRQAASPTTQRDMISPGPVDIVKDRSWQNQFEDEASFIREHAGATAGNEADAILSKFKNQLSTLELKYADIFGDTDPESVKAAYALALSIDTNIGECDVALMEVNRGILKGLQEKKEAADRSYEWWSDHELMFYSLGGVIVLLGKIFRIKGLAVEEE